MIRGMEKLGGRGNSFFYVINRCFQIPLRNQNSVGNCASLVTFSQNEINIILKVASILSLINDKIIEVKCSWVKRWTKGKRSTGDLIIQAGRIPHSIRG
jgi:hypothetical protein